MQVANHHRVHAINIINANFMACLYGILKQPQLIYRLLSIQCCIQISLTNVSPGRLSFVHEDIQLSLGATLRRTFNQDLRVPGVN